MDKFLCIKDNGSFEKGKNYFGDVELDGTLAINTDFYDDDYGEWHYLPCGKWKEFFKQTEF